MIPEDIRKTWGTFKFYSLLLVVFAASVYIAFTFGNQDYKYQRSEIAKLEHTMGNLAVENQRLSRELNILGVELEVQRLAAQQSQIKIQQGLERELQLKQDLQFYQKVMAPELQQDGFLIEAFEVKKSLSDHAYRYELVLMQQDKIKNVVKGTITITLIGSQGGSPQQYDFATLLTEQSQALTFSFKYFQTLQGEVILPEGFYPEQVQVNAQVFQFNRKRGALDKTFQWQPDAS